MATSSYMGHMLSDCATNIFSLRYRPISARSAIVSAAPDPARNSLSVRLVPSALLAALRCCRSVLCLIQARASAHRHTSVSASPVGLWHNNKMGVACRGKLDSQIQRQNHGFGSQIFGNFDFHQSTQGHFYSVLRMFGGSETPPRTFLDHSVPHTRQCNYTPAL